MGHLSRRRSDEDERRVLVALTDKGRALRQEAGDVFRCITAAAGMPLADIVRLTDELRTLRSKLEKAAAAIE